MRDVGPAGLAGLVGATAALRAEGALLANEAHEKLESMAAGVLGCLAAVVAIGVPGITAAVALKLFDLLDGSLVLRVGGRCARACPRPGVRTSRAWRGWNRGFPRAGKRGLEETVVVPECGDFGAEIWTQLLPSILQLGVPVHGHVGKLGTLLADKVLQRIEGSRTRARLLTDKGSEVGELISDSLVNTSTLLTFVTLVMPDARIVLSETVVEKFIKV